MAYKMILVCIAAITLHSVSSQVINRFVPNCGCSNILPVEPVLQNQYLLNSPLPGPTTVIQDSTVANNLANALQLLVVSNLLSNTLPLGDAGCGCQYGYPVEVAAPVVAPGVGCGCGCGLNGLGAVGLGPYGYNVLY